MRHYLTPLAAVSMLTLAACSGDAPADGPEDESTQVAADPSPSPAGDEAGREPAGDMEGEPDAQGHRWFYKADSRMALFGPPQSEGVLGITCGQSAAGNPAVRVTRYTAAEESGTQALRFIGPDADFAMQVSAEGMELGPDFVWQGTVPLPATGLRDVFAGNEGPISVQLESGNALEVPASEEVVRAIDACS